MIRPEGAGRIGFCVTKLQTRFDTNYLPPFQGGVMGWIIPGVKDDMSRQLAAPAAKLSAL
jgi:hypothetical protein